MPLQRASEEYAQAARDEALALEEEASSIASEIESDELFSESAREEFESLAEEADAEAKAARAESVLKRSVGHGVRAMGLALHAVATAALVVYVVVMRGLLYTVAPGVARMWTGEATVNGADFAERILGFLLHIGVIVGTVSSLPELSPGFEEMSTPWKVRSLCFLAVVAGVIESLGVHSTRTACHCHMKGMSVASIVSSAVLAFVSNLLRVVPVVMLEALILITIFGPGVFGSKLFTTANPVWIWGVLALTVCICIAVKLRLTVAETKLHQQSLGSEGEFLHAKSNLHSTVDAGIARGYGSLEYGSMEDVSLLTDECTSQSKPSSRANASKDGSSASGTNCLERCSKAFHDYWDRIRLSADLLTIALMCALLWQSWPLMKVLYPMAKTSFGMMTAWMSLPVMIGAGLLMVGIVHFLFVQ